MRYYLILALALATGCPAVNQIQSVRTSGITYVRDAKTEICFALGFIDVGTNYQTYVFKLETAVPCEKLQTTQVRDL